MPAEGDDMQHRAGAESTLPDGSGIPPAEALVALTVLGQDLRSVLVGAAGAAELSIATADDSRVRVQLQEVQQGLRGALELVDDLMSFAGAVSHAHNSDFTPAELLAECLAQAGSQVQRSAVVVRSVLGCGSDLVVAGDRGACELLITMLLRNAIVAATGHEVVAAVLAETDGDHARLTLRIGEGVVAPPDSDHLLELCGAITHRLGGRLERLADGGYELTLRLTLDPAGGRRAARTEEEPAVLRGRAALVVDDDPALRRVYATLLGTLGASCEEAADGVQAVERCRERRFDLVMMDLNMPRMDGIGATRAIREMAAESGVEAPPVLAITAMSDPQICARSISAGAVACLHKPLQRMQVVAAIQRCFDPDHSNVVDDAPQPVNGSVFAAEQVRQTIELMGGGAEAINTLRSLIESYRDATPEMVTELTAAIGHDVDGVERIAHTLKSRSAALGLAVACDAAARLECLAREGDLEVDDASVLVERFERGRTAGIERLEAYLTMEQQS